MYATRTYFYHRPYVWICLKQAYAQEADKPLICINRKHKENKDLAFFLN